MTAIGALVPVLLAAALWFLAPVLSRWVVGSNEESSQGNESLPHRSTLLQVAAIVIIAMAATTLPKMIYDIQNEYRRDPSITLMTSKIFPDAIQFFAKVIVGGIMILVVKKRYAPTITNIAEQITPADSH